MPVIGHQLVTEQPHGVSLQPFAEYLHPFDFDLRKTIAASQRDAATEIVLGGPTSHCAGL